MRFLLAALALCVGLFASPPSTSAPRPRPAVIELNLDILGFNEGDPYRLRAAEAEAVLRDPTATLFRFRSRDWMKRDGEGEMVPVTEVVSRYPGLSPAELVSVYRVDLDGDKRAEVLLIAHADALTRRHRYAPTVLRLGSDGYRPTWVSDELPGERHFLVDIRDLDGDGRPELLLAGEAGSSGYYRFHQLVGRIGRESVVLPVKHVDSLHYVDLDGDKKIEIVRRVRVGRRGPASQWTYADRLMQWDGAAFVDADERFPRYHDLETLPALISNLMDHYTAGELILEEKVDAVEEVRGRVLSSASRPRGFSDRLVDALADLQKGRTAAAREALVHLDQRYGYEPELLLALARTYAHDESWKKVLDLAIRTLTIDPRDRQAWWWAAVAFVNLEERSSALASLHLLTRLASKPADGVAFLQARRGEPGMEGTLQQVIDETINAFTLR